MSRKAIDSDAIHALARRAEEAGGKVLRTVLPEPVIALPESDNRPGRQEFTVHDWRPPSLNRLMRGRIAARIRLGKAARLLVCEAYREAGAYSAFRVKRRVSLVITLSGRQRPIDCDNGWKCLLDCLKHAGAIVDDSAKWCAIGSLKFERGPVTKTLVILEDMEEQT